VSLRFNPSSHRYWLDGRAVPGVTTLIGKGLPKPALPGWAARTVAEWVADNPDGLDQLRGMGREPMVNALKAVPWQRRDEAAVRGTDVHALAERVVAGEEVTVPDHLVGFVEGYAKLLDTTRLEPLLVEAQVASRTYWFAGTADLIARIDGEVGLLDLKTSSGIYGETALQTAAYASAEFYLGDGGEDDERPLPVISFIAAVHVTEHGSRLHRFPVAVDHAFKVFTHVAWVAKQVPDIDSWGLRWS
jgi:hypothetical protein